MEKLTPHDQPSPRFESVAPGIMALSACLENASPMVRQGVVEIFAQIRLIKASAPGEAGRATITLDQIAAIKHLLSNGNAGYLPLQSSNDPNVIDFHPLHKNGEAASPPKGVIGADHFRIIESGQDDRVFPFQMRKLTEIDGVIETSPLAEIISTPRQLQNVIRRSVASQVEDLVKLGAQPSNTISGVSGAGKSTFVKVIRNEAEEMGVDTRVIKGDHSIATTRGLLRTRKDDLPGHLPRELYALTEQTILAALYSVASQGRAITIEMPRMYQRKGEKPSIGHGRYEFPQVSKSEHLLLIEGSDTTGVMESVAQLCKIFDLPALNCNLWEIMPSADSRSMLDMLRSALSKAIARSLSKDSKAPSDGRPWIGEYVSWMADLHRRALGKALNVVLPSAY